MNRAVRGEIRRSGDGGKQIESAAGVDRVGHGMLDLLRDAFSRDSRVSIDYTRTGLRNGLILRVADLP